MFDITALPYIIFALLAIPPFVFGYFKGWRSGLFTLILTMISGGILVGVSFAIYDSALWPLFKNVFINSHNSAGLDVESLKEISKTSVISIVVGIGLIPFVPIMFGFYKLFKKLLNRYMDPKISKVKANEVNVTRKNLKLTKAGGVVFNGVAGLVVASAAAGAVSTLVTPSTKSNFFNTMTGGLGDVMTFGQAQYNEDYQRMFEFVNTRESGDPTLSGFKNVFYMNQEPATGKFGDIATTLAQFKTVKGFDNFVKETNLMAKDSKDISKALVLMLMESSKSQIDFRMVGFDSSKPSGKLTDPNTVAATEAGIISSLQNLERYVDTTSTGFTWNAQGVKEALEEIFGKRVVDFKSSPYFKNWEDQSGLRDQAKAELKARKGRLVSDTSEIASEREQQSQYIQSFKEQMKQTTDHWNELRGLVSKIGAGSHDVMPSTPDTSAAPWVDGWTYIDDDEKEIIKNQIIPSLPTFTDITRSPGHGSYLDMTDQKTVKETAEADYSAKITATSGSKKLLDSANGVLANLESGLTSLQSTQTTQQNELDTIQKTINEYPATSKDLNNKIDAEEKNLKALQAAAVRIANELTALKSEETVKQQAANKADSEANEADVNWSDANNKTPGLTSTYTTDQQEYNSAVGKAAAAEKSLAKLETALNLAKAEVAKEQTNYDNANVKYNIAKDNLVKNGQSTSTLAAPSRVNLEAAISKRDSAILARDTKAAEKNTADSEVATKKDAMDTSKGTLDSNLADVKRLATIKITKDAAKTKADKIRDDAVQAVTDKTKEQGTNSNDILTSKAKKADLAARILNAKTAYDTATRNKPSQQAALELAKKNVKDKSNDIEDQNNKIAVLQKDYNDKLALSDKALVTQTNAVQEYNRLSAIYNSDSTLLKTLVTNIESNKTKAGALKQSIDDANGDLKTNIHDKLVLEDKIDTDHAGSINFQIDALKKNEDLLKTAKETKDKELGFDEQRRNELIQLLTKLLS